MNLTRTIFVCFLFVLSSNSISQAQDDFSIHPYIQKPDGFVVKWYTRVNEPGQLNLSKNQISETFTSTPTERPELSYSEWEISQFGSELDLRPVFEHRIEIGDFGVNAERQDLIYEVRQGNSIYADTIKAWYDVRIIAFGDSETEPESNGKFADWPDPSGNIENRKYPVDQTTGFAENLKTIREQDPNFILIAGDLVESGGEQRDWDEFWRHMTHPNPDSSTAGSAIILAAPGNHEYYHGPSSGGYDQPFSEQAIAKFRSYFEFPDNEAFDDRLKDRYFTYVDPAIDLRIIALDVTNGLDHQSDNDTNFFLTGLNEGDGGWSPSVHPSSPQRQWLDEVLENAEESFIIVLLHHVPYSVGPHGWPAGQGNGFDPQSGVPVRSLIDLFSASGVDMVIAGHDEMYERSELNVERPEGDHNNLLHIYDVGIGGDGLRAPQEGLDNPFQQFLAHNDSAEEFESNGVTLSDGGKHYGHLDISYPNCCDALFAFVKPIYNFPVSTAGIITTFERRIYDDEIVFSTRGTGVVKDRIPANSKLKIFPNPSSKIVDIEIDREKFEEIEISIIDQLGRVLYRTELALTSGWNNFRLNIQDLDIPPGTHYISLESFSEIQTKAFTVTR